MWLGLGVEEELVVGELEVDPLELASGESLLSAENDHVTPLELVQGDCVVELEPETKLRAAH